MEKIINLLRNVARGEGCFESFKLSLSFTIFKFYIAFSILFIKIILKINYFYLHIG